ncbi:hypothetical protein N7U49_44050 [Streptomyces sp. AD2-2]|nr:hypothetical protein N7U49_44050 [Streptomyces sp. AD2-2]
MTDQGANAWVSKVGVECLYLGSPPTCARTTSRSTAAPRHGVPGDAGGDSARTGARQWLLGGRDDQRATAASTDASSLTSQGTGSARLPGAIIRSATEREDDERLQPRAALRLFTDPPRHPSQTRRLAVGSDADLCLLHLPLREALRTPTGELGRAIYVLGRRIGPA